MGVSCACSGIGEDPDLRAPEQLLHDGSADLEPDFRRKLEHGAPMFGARRSGAAQMLGLCAGATQALRRRSRAVWMLLERRSGVARARLGRCADDARAPMGTARTPLGHSRGGGGWATTPDRSPTLSDP